ncbi:hypothetical protein GCM10027031_02720 [Corynebacterium atrinae]
MTCNLDARLIGATLKLVLPDGSGEQEHLAYWGWEVPLSGRQLPALVQQSVARRDTLDDFSRPQ